MTQGYLEEELEVLVVGDDAVVDDDELVVLAGGVRVGVDRGRNTVGGPPSGQKLFSKSAPIMLVLPQAAMQLSIDFWKRKSAVLHLLTIEIEEKKPCTGREMNSRLQEIYSAGVHSTTVL